MKLNVFEDLLIPRHVGRVFTAMFFALRTTQMIKWEALTKPPVVQKHLGWLRYLEYSANPNSSQTSWTHKWLCVQTKSAPLPHCLMRTEREQTEERTPNLERMLSGFEKRTAHLWIIHVDGSEIPNNHVTWCWNLVNHGDKLTNLNRFFSGFLNHQQYTHCTPCWNPRFFRWVV